MGLVTETILLVEWMKADEMDKLPPNLEILVIFP